VVIRDMQMPVLDGWSATKEIRALERANIWPQTPIIALTASASNEDRELCREAGCTALLTKPLALSELLEAVRKHGTLPVDAALSSNKASSEEPLDPEVQSLLPIALRDLRQRAEAIWKSLASDAFEEIGRCGHQLVGVGTVVGGPSISDLGRALEEAAAKRERTKVNELVPALEERTTALQRFSLDL